MQNLDLLSPVFQAFHPDLRATFLDRPNRFVVRAETAWGPVEAHCPNPGRMTELLFPGAPVILERAPGPRKLAWTLAAVERPGPGGPTVIPLVSVRANGAVGALHLPRKFPGARRIRPEFALEGSRFDFFVEDAGGRPHLVEVKACSEVEHGTALFPDAPSDRARRHLEELAAWADRGYQVHVVFAVVHGSPRTFGPNIHTDPAFSRALGALAHRIDLEAVVLESGADGSTRKRGEAALDLSGCQGPDSGLVVRTEKTEGGWKVEVQAFPEGWAKALSRAPARTSFGVRTDPAHAGRLAADLGPPDRRSDPCRDPAFIGAVMAWRHGAIRGLER